MKITKLFTEGDPNPPGFDANMLLLGSSALFNFSEGFQGNHPMLSNYLRMAAFGCAALAAPCELAFVLRENSYWRGRYADGDALRLVSSLILTAGMLFSGFREVVFHNLHPDYQKVPPMIIEGIGIILAGGAQIADEVS